MIFILLIILFLKMILGVYLDNLDQQHAKAINSKYFYVKLEYKPHPNHNSILIVFYKDINPEDLFDENNYIIDDKLNGGNSYFPNFIKLKRYYKEDV